MKNLILTEDVECDIYGTIYKYPKGTVVIKDVESNQSLLRSPLIIEVHGHGLYAYAKLDQCEIVDVPDYITKEYSYRPIGDIRRTDLNKPHRNDNYATMHPIGSAKFHDGTPLFYVSAIDKIKFIQYIKDNNIDYDAMVGAEKKKTFDNWKNNQQ